MKKHKVTISIYYLCNCKGLYLIKKSVNEEEKRTQQPFWLETVIAVISGLEINWKTISATLLTEDSYSS